MEQIHELNRNDQWEVKEDPDKIKVIMNMQPSLQ